MVSAKTTKAMAFAAAFAAVAEALTIATPASLVTCQPVQLSWADGTGPFYLAVIPGGQPSAAALENLPSQTGNMYTWNVNLAAGTSVTLKITDSTGTIAYSDKVTIQAGSSTTCVGQAVSGSAAAATGAATSGVSSAAAAPVASAASSTRAVTSASAMVTSMSSAATSARSSASSAAASSPTGMSSGGTAAAASAASTRASASTTSGASTTKVAAGLVLGAVAAACALMA